MLRTYTKLAFRAVGVALTAVWICVESPGSIAVAATLTPQQITQFQADPAAALARYPSGGAELISFIRDLVVTDGATLNSILALIPTATREQQSAMGTGLGQAARALFRPNPPLASQIRTLLVACESCQNAVLAYGGVTGNDGGGAGTDRGGGGGSGGSGPTGNGPATGGSNGSTGPAGSTFFGNNSGNLLTGGGGAVSSVTGGGSTTSTSPF